MRKRLKNDKYRDVTRNILSTSETNLNILYHPSCHRKYTAVKRSCESVSPSDENTPKRLCIETRRCSALPKSDKQGMLKGSCIFCGKSRKKKNRKEEPRCSVAVLSSCDLLKERAINSKNERLKSLMRSGVDLIAKEAEYHKSCRVQFLLETENKDKAPDGGSSHFHHKIAFASLVSYIQNEVIANEKSMLISDLLSNYKEEYISAGGDRGEIATYTPQSLTRKIREHFNDRITIGIVDYRKGNIIYSSSCTLEDAKHRLHDDAQKYEEESKIRWAALYLRSKIMQLPKTKNPDPTNVKNLKECSSDIPSQLKLFFESLLGGISPTFTGSSKESFDRKVTAMSSDAVYNVSRGTVKPWKQTIMGLGFASLTGSKLAMQILNRAGHSISYSETKGIETEFAYAVNSDERDAPDGICLDSSLATASVWDNNDANMETLDGKETLHMTVGHTYQNVSEGDHLDRHSEMDFREVKNRRKFVGVEKQIQPFRKAINKAQFIHPPTSSNDLNDYKVGLKLLDLYWFWKQREGNTPMHAGFMSKYIKDPLPLQRICYMDPIPRSPTNNEVVRETMIRTLNIAKETKQDFAVVTYDLAIALKAYSIQAIETPLFDNLLILLGNFHIELAFYGAVGTLINESGIEFILAEADILAEGSMRGFIKGKFYNRCSRIHELLANVLEQKLYDRFLLTIPEEELDSFKQVMSTVPLDPEKAEEYLSNENITRHLELYEAFFQSFLDGDFGSTAKFWAIYIFLINRLHRELQRCVKTNDVKGYMDIFPIMLRVYFSLNRPNYARWGTLFLHKLKNAGPTLLQVLEKGAFSIRRTKKDYSRSAVDLSLEQTVNRDAASTMKGIVAFRNSEQAMRRWSLTMTQRAMAVNELRTFAGLEVGQNATIQCRPSRILKDNSQMTTLGQKIDQFCNPFSEDAPVHLVNLTTGQAAAKNTESYLLNALQRGEEEMCKFEEEWTRNSSRFLQPVKRTAVHNFAHQNVNKKTKISATQSAKTNAESLRDMFVRMIVVIAENTAFDLQKVLSHPITSYPLSLAHCDGSHVKTDKSALMKKLESIQRKLITEDDLPRSYALVYDGGLLLHSVLSQTNMGASYASIARTFLSVVCSGRSSEVHVCLDKYVENSIKDSERRLRGAVDSIYIITGPDQTIRQSGKKLLINGVFKNELSKFLLKEWQNDHYWNILGGKTLYASYGGECIEYRPDENQHINASHPSHLQGDHEEADTLIAFHVANISDRNVVVRASDTDVSVILIGALGNQRREVRATTNIMMDWGTGNSRRFINLSDITDVLEDMAPGLPRAMLGYHAFTGCDFTSAFFR